MCGLPVHQLPIGTLGKDDDDGSENVGKKMNWHSFELISCLFGPTQMQVTFPGVEFSRILFRFKNRKENSSSYVHLLQKTSN